MRRRKPRFALVDASVAEPPAPPANRPEPRLTFRRLRHEEARFGQAAAPSDRAHAGRSPRDRAGESRVTIRNAASSICRGQCLAV